MYVKWQKNYYKIKKVCFELEFVKGYSDDLYNSLGLSDRKLLILHDQMSEKSNTKSLTKLFTKDLHHRNDIIYYLLQNKIEQGKS